MFFSKPSFPMSLVLLSAAVAITGCGENRAVTGSDPSNPNQAASDSAQAASVEVKAEATVESKAAEGIASKPQAPAELAKIDGKDGKDGNDGLNGKDATDPKNALSKVGNGQNGKDGDNGNATADASATAESGKNGKDGKDGKDASANAIVSTESKETTPPAVPEVVVLNGKDGANGKDGSAGKDGRDACVSIVQNPPKFEAQALTPVDLAAYKKNGFKDLPYLASVPTVTSFNKKNGKHVGVNVTTIHTGSTAASAPKRMITDMMTIFDIEVKLPARATILKTVPFKATVHLSMHKKSVDRTDDTEMLCILDAGVCSGAPYHKNMIWGNLLNPKFGDKAFINKVFSDNLAAAMSLSSAREFAQPVDFDLAQLLAPAGQRLSDEEVLDFLYGKENMDKPLVRTIRILVADDTQVVNTPTEQSYIEVNYGYNGCQIEDAEKAGK